MPFYSIHSALSVAVLLVYFVVLVSRDDVVSEQLAVRRSQKRCYPHGRINVLCGWSCHAVRVVVGKDRRAGILLYHQFKKLSRKNAGGIHRSLADELTKSDSALVVKEQKIHGFVRKREEERFEKLDYLLLGMLTSKLERIDSGS